MNESKLVSVVIPMYNSEDSIKDVLKGIENQTNSSRISQVVVVNDGSTDNSKLKVEEYIKHTSLNVKLINTTNGGVSLARNIGVRNIQSSQWIAFCDSDDIWLPNKIERMFEILDMHPEIDCIGGAYSNKTLLIGFRKIDYLYKANVKDICLTSFPQPSTVIMKKKVFDEIGGFDETQRYAEDGNFFLRVAANYNLYYIPEKLIEFGYGKRAFGEKGLSANLIGMYKGNVKNLREMRSLGYISTFFYWQMRCFYFAKYIRRILLTKFTHILKKLEK